jgi:hypothetical protein
LIVIHQSVEILASGQHRVIAPGFTAEFRSGDVTTWEEDEARQHFTFRGTVTEEGSERPIDPIPSRVGSFDTARIGDSKLRAEIEQKMLAHSDHGRDFRMVEKPQLAAPWPNYSKVKGGGAGRTTAKVISEQVQELGLDPADVMAYERDNANREEVLAALSKLEKLLEPVEEELVIA